MCLEMRGRGRTGWQRRLGAPITAQDGTARVPGGRVPRRTAKVSGGSHSSYVARRYPNGMLTKIATARDFDGSLSYPTARDYGGSKRVRFRNSFKTGSNRELV